MYLRPHESQLFHPLNEGEWVLKNTNFALRSERKENGSIVTLNESVPLLPCSVLESNLPPNEASYLVDRCHRINVNENFCPLKDLFDLSLWWFGNNTNGSVPS